MIKGRGMKKGLFQIMGQLLLMVLCASIAYADFGLLLGSFKSRDNAENYATKIVKSLFDYPCNAFVEGTEIPGKGLWYRVCLGPFVTRKEVDTEFYLILQQHDFYFAGLYYGIVRLLSWMFW